MSVPLGQPKPFASLSSSLLARKGQAKPAMRPQGFSGFGPVTESFDDLGWNDMGLSEPHSAPAMMPVAEPTPLPQVLRQREQLKDDVASAARSREAPVAAPASPLASPKRVTHRKRDTTPPAGRGGRGKAAFTLRLDGDRHLRLRLASALCNRSSQQLVTEALDTFLKTLPEVEAMADRFTPNIDAETDNGG